MNGAAIVSWFMLSGFIMPLEWIMPEDSNHEHFIVEYKPEHGGWREAQTVPRDWRMTIIEEHRQGQWCYRVRAINGAGRSGPSQIKCGYNEEN